jgi:hypothetical protein
VLKATYLYKEVPMRNSILMLLGGIIFLILLNFQAAIHTPLVRIEVMVLFAVSILGLVAVRRN